MMKPKVEFSYDNHDWLVTDITARDSRDYPFRGIAHIYGAQPGPGTVVWWRAAEPQCWVDANTGEILDD
jgi:hypothetical protein